MPIGNIGFNSISKLSGVTKKAAKAPIQPQKSECFRGSNTYNLAKEFQKKTVDIFSDFKTGLPKDGEAGCKVLSKTLSPFTEQLKL